MYLCKLDICSFCFWVTEFCFWKTNDISASVVYFQNKNKRNNNITQGYKILLLTEMIEN